jgi:hypothetical protein
VRLRALMTSFLPDSICYTNSHLSFQDSGQEKLRDILFFSGSLLNCSEPENPVLNNTSCNIIKIYCSQKAVRKSGRELHGGLSY